MELLSPAGNYRAMALAVQNGANAVYIGGNMFSARANAENFTIDEIERAADYCHLRGVKLYVACNTLIKDFEFSELYPYIENLYRIGVDALIVQDLGVMKIVMENFPDFKINASTQMTVHNSDGALFLEENGISRAVLAREASKKDIESIRENSELELEVFVHGALCICYSGQCLFSSMLGGRSGNRGGCAQPCRLNYTLMEGDSEISRNLSLISPKDLCLVSRLDELKQMGVDSLKIEGRMKSPEYVGMVTRVYRNALDGKVDDKSISDMLSLFSRGGSSEGYFDGTAYGKMMDYDTPSAKITAGKSVERSVGKTENEENIKTEIELKFYARESMSLCAKCGEFTATAQGEPPEPAINRPTTADRVIEQLKKLGNTPFSAEKISVEMDDDIAISISAINEMRRAVVLQLSEQIVKSYKREVKKLQPMSFSIKTRSDFRFSVEAMTEQQAETAWKMGIDEVFISTPPIIKDGEKCNLYNSDKVLIQNISGLMMTEFKTVYTGHRLNVYNKHSLDFLAKKGVYSATVSPELNLRELTELCSFDGIETEVIGYGYIPLMYMENCILKSNNHCGRCKSDKGIFIKDRLNVKFPVITQNCRNIILNSRPLYMADKLEDLRSVGADRIKLLFTTETEEEVSRIINEYRSGKPSGSFSEITRGHFYRGVI